jgi:hypothetical protein
LKAVNNIITTCRNELGISIALDDFGTGYSSLTHLRHLSVDTVKIDQSFVHDVLDDPDDYAIIESVIGLSHAFNRKIIAEGVESLEQGLVLLLLECHLLQGYAIAKPMPAEAIADWVKNYRPYAEWQFYADAELSAEQIMVTIRRIETQQWLLRIKNCLFAETGTSPSWPIMERTKTHLGRWIRQARQNSQTGSQWLEQLDELHQELHGLAMVLMHQFNEGQIEAAQAGFVKLQTIFQELDELFAHYGNPQFTTPI